MVAVGPDAPTTVSALVTTKKNLPPVPVLGVRTIAQVVRNGDQLCHSGIASGEQCGELLSPVADRDGAFQIHAKAASGDSGGPVYVYQRSKGHVVGVYAVGMTLQAGSYCLGRFCLDVTKFVPMKTVTDQLGVSVLTS
jgi:hypothetical protein